jgi:hypothetical protein
MKTIHDLPNPERVEALARRAGMERSLYLGEAIGHMLSIAWEALASLGASLRGSSPRRRPGPHQA